MKQILSALSRADEMPVRIGKYPEDLIWVVSGVVSFRIPRGILGNTTVCYCAVRVLDKNAEDNPWFSNIIKCFHVYNGAMGVGANPFIDEYFKRCGMPCELRNELVSRIESEKEGLKDDSLSDHRRKSIESFIEPLEEFLSGIDSISSYDGSGSAIRSRRFRNKDLVYVMSEYAFPESCCCYVFHSKGEWSNYLKQLRLSYHLLKMNGRNRDHFELHPDKRWHRDESEKMNRKRRRELDISDEHGIDFYWDDDDAYSNWDDVKMDRDFAYRFLSSAMDDVEFAFESDSSVLKKYYPKSVHFTECDVRGALLGDTYGHYDPLNYKNNKIDSIALKLEDLDWSRTSFVHEFAHSVHWKNRRIAKSVSLLYGKIIGFIKSNGGRAGSIWSVENMEGDFDEYYLMEDFNGGDYYGALKSLAARGFPEVEEAVGEVFEKSVRNFDEHDLFAALCDGVRFDLLAGNARCPSDLLLKISRSCEDEEVFLRVISNPRCPEDLLNGCDPEDMIRNPRCPRGILEKMSESDDMEVLDTVAGNPNCPEEIICDLLQGWEREPWDTLCENCAKNPNCPEDFLRMFFSQRKYLYSIAQNPNCPIDLLYELASDDDKHVSSLARNGVIERESKSRCASMKRGMVVVAHPMDGIPDKCRISPDGLGHVHVKSIRLNSYKSPVYSPWTANLRSYAFQNQQELFSVIMETWFDCKRHGEECFPEMKKFVEEEIIPYL